MVKLFIKIKHCYINWQLRRAVKKADWMAKLSGSKILVLRYKGGFMVKSKKHLKRLIKEGRFAHGFTIQTAERIALYKTS
jgi:hypothetical protein